MGKVVDGGERGNPGRFDTFLQDEAVNTHTGRPVQTRPLVWIPAGDNKGDLCSGRRGGRQDPASGSHPPLARHVGA